jgi:hypothetical protein
MAYIAPLPPLARIGAKVANVRITTNLAGAGRGAVAGWRRGGTQAPGGGVCWNLASPAIGANFQILALQGLTP